MEMVGMLRVVEGKKKCSEIDERIGKKSVKK